MTAMPKTNWRKRTPVSRRVETTFRVVPPTPPSMNLDLISMFAGWGNFLCRTWMWTWKWVFFWVSLSLELDGVTLRERVPDEVTDVEVEDG